MVQQYRHVNCCTGCTSAQAALQNCCGLTKGSAIPQTSKSRRSQRAFASKFTGKPTSHKGLQAIGRACADHFARIQGWLFRGQLHSPHLLPGRSPSSACLRKSRPSSAAWSTDRLSLSGLIMITDAPLYCMSTSEMSTPAQSQRPASVMSMVQAVAASAISDLSCLSKLLLTPINLPDRKFSAQRMGAKRGT